MESFLVALIGLLYVTAGVVSCTKYHEESITRPRFLGRIYEFTLWWTRPLDAWVWRQSWYRKFAFGKAALAVLSLVVISLASPANADTSERSGDEALAAYLLFPNLHSIDVGDHDYTISFSEQKLAEAIATSKGFAIVVSRVEIAVVKLTEKIRASNPVLSRVQPEEFREFLRHGFMVESMRAKGKSLEEAAELIGGATPANRGAVAAHTEETWKRFRGMVALNL